MAKSKKTRKRKASGNTPSRRQSPTLRTLKVEFEAARDALCQIYSDAQLSKDQFILFDYVAQTYLFRLKREFGDAVPGLDAGRVALILAVYEACDLPVSEGDIEEIFDSPELTEEIPWRPVPWTREQKENAASVPERAVFTKYLCSDCNRNILGHLLD